MKKDIFPIVRAVFLNTAPERYDSFPSTLAELKALVARMEAEIPAESHASTRIELDTYESGGYGPSSTYPCIEITYLRPETVEEIAAREKCEQDRIDQVKQAELQRLAELRAKYGV